MKIRWLTSQDRHWSGSITFALASGGSTLTCTQYCSGESQVRIS